MKEMIIEIIKLRKNIEDLTDQCPKSYEQHLKEVFAQFNLTTVPDIIQKDIIKQAKQPVERYPI